MKIENGYSADQSQSTLAAVVALGKGGPLCKLNGGALFFTHHFSMIYLHLQSVADLENFGGGGILSTKLQKFGCLHRN